MDEATREYLDAVNKLAEDPKPYPLSEEIIWADCMVALASNARFLSIVEEFKKRSREE